jgi:hypothetical protein
LGGLLSAAALNADAYSCWFGTVADCWRNEKSRYGTGGLRSQINVALQQKAAQIPGNV